MPISVRDCFEGHELSEPRLSPDGRKLAYIRSSQAPVDAETDASLATGLTDTRIVVRTLDETTEEVSSPWQVRGARALGGGCFDWTPDSSGIFAVTRTGELRLWTLDGSEHLLVEPLDGRTISGPTMDTGGHRLAFVVDQSEIRELDLTTKEVRRLDDGGFEFAIDPVWWKDRFVWHAWSPPQMPWNESCLAGEKDIVRGQKSTQFQQPQVSRDGARLGWLDDTSGWLNVVVDGHGRVDESFEHGGPTWGERQRSWCFDDSGRRIAFVRNENGFGRLCTFDVDTGRTEDKAKAVHGQLSWRGDSLAAIRTGGITPPQIVLYDTRADEWTRSVIEIGSTFDWPKSSALVEPKLLEIPHPNEPNVVLHARLYTSPSSTGKLLCWFHGGPTDQWQVTFMPRFSYWIDRGYDILVPDFRGSTGHGRPYTEALNGNWGILDVADAIVVLEDVSSRLGYSPASIGLLGSSAGGLTALCVAAKRSELIAAVAVAYPVSDIAGLDQVTHRFEAHYNRSLVGQSDETRRLSAERSPIAFGVELARVPVLCFHGTEDPVVPIDHSRRLMEAIHQNGGRVEFVEFAEEGHGFRKLDNKIAEFTQTERFLDEHLGGTGTTRHLG
ncbi:MAG: S9 family peptidase [Actinomycetota bacterium]